MLLAANKKVRILFLGEMISSHAQSWMGLLDSASDQFETLGLGVPGSPYPEVSKVRLFKIPRRVLTSSRLPKFFMKFVLHFIIKTFKPDVIHTFAAFPTSAVYNDVIRQYQPTVKWVLQVRGGPDVYMNRFNTAKKKILAEIFNQCDVLIADNEINYEIAEGLGLESRKRWSYGIAPGTGGIDLAEFSDALKPSLSSKQVVWTKAYEGYESKGLPVLEAIKLAWPSIRGTKFIFAASGPDIQQYMNFLPQEIRDCIEVHPRLPRHDILNLMKVSRVVMAPSLLEGVPNALYESMVSQCVPVFSPLETYRDKFIDGLNVVYARNLYPQEIADALIKALSDDVYADKIAENNLKAVAEIANRRKIQKSIIQLYQDLASRNQEI